MIIGNSPIEKFWLAAYRRALQHLENRVTLEWLNELAVDDMAKRVADLPPRSAIYYAHVHVRQPCHLNRGFVEIDSWQPSCELFTEACCHRAPGLEVGSERVQ